MTSPQHVTTRRLYLSTGQRGRTLLAFTTGLSPGRAGVWARRPAPGDTDASQRHESQAQKSPTTFTGAGLGVCYAARRRHVIGSICSKSSAPASSIAFLKGILRIFRPLYDRLLHIGNSRLVTFSKLLAARRRHVITRYN